jgi:spore maturation protein CgeB
LRNGEAVSYIAPGGLGDFDLVLSYTGGLALESLRRDLGARRVAPLYGSADPAQHHPVPPTARFQAAISYLGTYSKSRQNALENLFVDVARQRPDWQFRIAGTQYPDDFPWKDNISLVRHLPPAEHSAFFCSARLSLNVTRRAMVEMGYCPSGRLFEAACCGAPLMSDAWEGLDCFFHPGEEILVARTSQEVLAALDLPDEQLRQMAEAARDRVLAQHTAMHRAIEFESLMEPSLALAAR